MASYFLPCTISKNQAWLVDLFAAFCDTTEYGYNLLLFKIGVWLWVGCAASVFNLDWWVVVLCAVTSASYADDASVTEMKADFDILAPITRPAILLPEVIYVGD